jgi:hypothetical protein
LDGLALLRLDTAQVKAYSTINIGQRFVGSTDQTRAHVRAAISDRSSNTMSESTPSIAVLIAAPSSRSSSAK